MALMDHVFNMPEAWVEFPGYIHSHIGTHAYAHTYRHLHTHAHIHVHTQGVLVQQS